MKNLLLLLILTVGVGAFIKKCGPSRADARLEFEGTWTLANESEIVGGKEEQTARVWVKKDRFKIVSQHKSTDMRGDPIESEVTTVFDGKELHVKTVFAPRRNYQGEMTVAPPETSSRPPVAGEVDGIRFWTKSFQGNAGPGGQVAGRETLLYSVKARRPDAESTEQAWVDAKTGVVLRSNNSLFSRQVNMTVGKETLECVAIRYGVVADGEFTKP
jgi:hypothetical protein